MDVLATLRRQPGLNLFPIENRLSPRALEALSSDADNRYPYSETDVAGYGDVTGLDDVFTHCVDLTKQFYGARHAFVNLLSGLQTMHTVISAVAKAGDRVMMPAPEDGGHYATETMCRGYGHEVDFLPFDRGALEIDYAKPAARVAERPVDLICLDAATGRPGLRLGIQELTRRGMREKDTAVVADLLARLLLSGEAAEEIAEDVAALALSCPGVAFAGPLAPLAFQ